MNRTLIIGALAGMGVAVLWASWIVSTRHGVQNTLTIYDIMALRFGIAGLVILPWAIRSKLWRGLTAFRIAVIVAVTGPPYALLGYVSLIFAPAAHFGVFMNGLTPVFTLIVGWLWVRERIGLSRGSGVVLLLSGAGLIGFEALGGAGGSRVWVGDLLMLASALVFALHMMTVKVWSLTLGQVLFCVCTVSGVLYLPLWLAVLPSNLGAAPWNEIWLQAGFQGLIPNLMGTSLVYVAIRALGPIRTSVFISTVPVLAALIAIPILSEVPSVTAWIGIAVVTLGVLLAMGAVGRRERSG
jgi:drug/metabolite transporter (DMT)-like permease